VTPDEIRQRLRKLLRERRIPRQEPAVVSERRGVQDYCCVCNQRIEPTEVTHELSFVEDPGTLTTYLFHSPCYALWKAEVIAMSGGEVA
jgi:hypothetical protein